MSKVGKNKLIKGGVLGGVVYLGHDIVASGGRVYLNRGVSFGQMLSGYLPMMFFLGWLVFFLIWGIKSRFWLAFMGILIGGGVNLVDRIRFGAVRDYFNFFSVFYNNLADWIIFFSVVYFVYIFLNNERSKNKKDF